MRTAFLLLIIFCSTAISAAAQQITGHVESADKKPLAFVSVAILRDSSFIAGTITNESGDFQLPATLSTGTTYLLRLSLVGYHTLVKKFVYPDATSLSQLTLISMDQTLREVTVSSKKPLITRRSDRYVVNVENSYLANGNSGLDVLQRAEHSPSR
ncbi:MAG: hypothetical protein EOO38_25870 [Cytophagaceae bacterium]|nr:MAG: hypothetical protein EOO38_25870 [Cytophagaceae bacterium]